MVILQSKENVTRRKNVKLKKIFLLSFGIIFFATVIILSVFLFNKFFLKNSAKIKNLKQSWSEYQYEKVYEISREILQDDFFNNTALIYNGYSAFYLAISQLDSATVQNYLDESINSLRLALLSAKKHSKPQIEYMLGKAYFYKNSVNSYYYSDLAVKYLDSAKKHGYKADDLSEYLGLSYASLGKTMESIHEFTDALLVRESDFLLLSIAEQYKKMGQAQTSMQYLFRIIKNCKDEELVIKSRNLLGNIYLEEKKYSEAKAEFEEILKLNKNSADAYYGLGLIYENQGDLIKARSEWRKALKLHVNHSGALEKISSTSNR